MRKSTDFRNVVLAVKGSFFDDIYRRQNLVDVLTNKIGDYPQEVQDRLKELFTQQASLVEKLVRELEDISVASSTLTKIGMAIKELEESADLALANNAGEAVNEDTNEPVAAQESIEAVNETSSEAVVSEETATDKDTRDVVVDNSAQMVDSTTAPEVQAAQPEVVTVSSDDSADSTEITEASVTEEKVQEPSISTDGDVTVSDAGEIDTQSSTDEISDSSTVIASEDVVPATASATGEVEKDEPVVNAEAPKAQEPVSTEEVSEEKFFTLSPIDDGITLVDKKADLPGEGTIAVVSDTTVTNNQVSEEKYVKVDNNPAKAILVTALQFDKLANSRDTQKVAFMATNSSEVSELSGATPLVKADEQTLMANGLLTPTEDATKKQMEGIMEQANALYKEGKTGEAQALYNQVSSMNQAMQASAGQEENAKVLVNTPAVVPAVAA